MRHHPLRINHPLPGHIPRVEVIVGVRAGQVFEADAHLAGAFCYIIFIISISNVLCGVDGDQVGFQRINLKGKREWFGWRHTLSQE